MKSNLLAYRRYPEPRGTKYFAENLNTEQNVIELFDYCQIQEAIIYKEGWEYLIDKFGAQKLFALNHKSGWLDSETLGEYLEYIQIHHVLPDSSIGMESINVIPKSGEESFISKGENTNFKLKEFWSWAQSDLLNNTLRGVLAEFIVMKDIGIEAPPVKLEWNAYDLETTDGIKIEVKSSAYLQSWYQKDFSKISFDVALKRGWDAKTNEYCENPKRQADYYVFCLLDHRDKETVDPMNLEQWVFYVLSTEVLDEKIGAQKRISLNSLKSLDPVKCKFGEIRNAIRKNKGG